MKARTAAGETRAAAADEAVRAALRVPGVPLEPATRERFEAAFGCDLGHVRVHTDALADRAARALEAAAFALGRDVFFAAGTYAPRSRSGGALVAHELAHAIEDPRTADPAGGDALGVAAPHSLTERGANEAAARLGRGAPFAVAPAPAPRAERPQIARFAAGLILRDPNDPAQLVATLVRTIKIALGNDPDDRLGRVRRSIEFLDDDTRKLALERLSVELLSPEWQRLSGLLGGDQSAPAAADGGDGRAAQPAAAVAETGADGDAEGREAAADGVAGTKPAAAEARGTGAPPEPPDAEHAAKPKPGQTSDEKPGAKPDAKPEGAHEPAGQAVHGMRLHGAGPRRPRAAGSGAHAGPRKRPAGGAAVALPSLSAGSEPAAPEPAEAPAVEAESDAGAAGAADGPESAEAGAAEPASAEVTGVESPGGDATPEIPLETESSPQAGARPETAEAETEPRGAAPETQAETAPETARPDDAEPQGSATSSDGLGAASTESEAAAANDASGEVPADDATAEPPAPQAGAGPPLTDVPSETDDNSETPSGGGGGGAAIPEAADEPPAPAPSEGEPAEVLGAVAGETPDQLATVMGGVRAAVGRTVGSDRRDLAAHPPEVGAAAAARAAGTDVPAAAANAALPHAVERVPAGATPASVALPPASEPAPVAEIAPPRITSNADGQLTAEDAQAVSEAVDDLPTTDPSLDVSVAPPPDVELTGAADPAKADAQREQLARTTETATAGGRSDAAQPQGEDHIVARPLGRLRAQGQPAAAGGPGGASAQAEPGGVPDRAVAIVAREKSGDDVTAAARRGAADLGQKRTEQHARAAQEREDSQRAIDAEITKNVDEQRATRERARREVRASRTSWRKEQDDAAAAAENEGTTTVVAGRSDVLKKRDDGRAEARRQVDDGNREVAATRKEAEAKARTERARAKAEADDAGFFSRVASAIGSFFDKIKNAIHGFFSWARDKIKAAIDRVTKLVTSIIDKVRDAIVAAIKAVGDALIAIGDRLLAAFPALRERFRAAIHKLVDGAVAAVNRLADGLKKAVTGLLNLLGKALTAILDAYEALYMAAIDLVAGAIKGALDAARALVSALGTFAVLIRDIARGPGQWISNFGAACVDGLRNHLWPELKAAVKEWFNSKVEAVVGIGKLIYQVLFKGGFPFRRIAAMAWAAVKAAIPRAIIEFLIQKVISLIIPAAGAIMAIIEGLQAAWATVSRIIAAFERFVAFLKAVKDGNAGVLFARAIAAAAVAVIDFTANFIISKIGKAAKGVGSKLSAIAGKLMAWLKRGARAGGRAIKAVGRTIARGVRAAGRGLRAAGRWVANSRVGRYIRGSRVGKFVGKQVEKVRAGLQSARERFRKWREKRNSPEGKAARLQAAVRAIRPKAHALLTRGVGRTYFWIRAQGWILRYGLSALGIKGGQLVATVNPSAPVDAAEERALGQFLLETFSHVEAVLRAAFTRDPAAAAWRSGDPDLHDPKTFAGLSRFAQSSMIRSGNPVLNKRIIEPGVSAKLSHEDNPGAIEVRFGGSSPRYLALSDDPIPKEVGIVPMIENASKQLDLSDRESAGLLISSREQLDANLALLEESFARRKGQTRPPGWRERAYRTFRRASFLVGALEPARRSGIASVASTSFSLAFSGKASVREVVGGELAPMAHALAASQRNPSDLGPSEAKQLRDARAATEQKVYRVMARLRQVANAEQIVVSPGGFNLAAFASAVENFLLAHITNEPGRIIDELELKLAAELSVFLKAMHSK